MTKIFIVRHGIYNNPDNIIPFRSNDVSLTQEGREQIERDAKLLQQFNPAQIYSSPIKRCEETAQILAETLKIGIVYEDGLKEIDSPAYQNTSQSEYKKLIQDKSIYANAHHLKEGGESLEQVQLHVDRVLKKVLDENKDDVAIIVSHGDPIMVMIMDAQNQKIDIDKTIESQCDYIRKGEIYELDFDNYNLVKFKKHKF